MFDNSFTLLIFSWIGAVAGWTYTDYLTSSTGRFLHGEKTVTSTFYHKVYPTGSVSPTSTNTTTVLISHYGHETGTLTYPITVTQLFLSPADISCTSPLGCSPSNTASPTTTIDTKYYAPLVVSAPSSCTKTSFLYTTSQPVYATSIGTIYDYTDLTDQATQSSEALFITTYIYTLSTNLGGQAVTTTRCDVYLKDKAVLGVGPREEESSYLDQCVDPRRFLCTSTATVASGACEVTGGAYLPDGKTGGVQGTGSLPTASSTAKGGVSGLGLLRSQGLYLLALVMSILVFSLL